MQDPKYFYTLNYNNIMIPKSKKSKSDGCLQQISVNIMFSKWSCICFLAKQDQINSNKQHG